MIDPRGALNEAELWTEPCYDVAKLSHSLCGNYDFFNAGLYEIDRREKPHLRLEHENKTAIDIFKTYLDTHHFDFASIRLFEASLFLSMLPLHIDDPEKVLGFILNAIEILQELENA